MSVEKYAELPEDVQTESLHIIEPRYRDGGGCGLYVIDYNWECIENEMFL